MKWLAAVVFVCMSVRGMAQDGNPFLERMYHRYHGKWRSSLIFTQHTEKYRNDSLLATETWYETMVYPSFFRIDFGLPDSGNCVIFRNDSAYIFRAHKLMKSRADTNELLYLLGGIYYSPSFADVCNKFRAFGIDPGKSYWHDANIIVIGATGDSASANQVWVEARTYNVVRLIKFHNGHKSDARFSRHRRVGSTRCETLVEFYEDGRLRQKEVYTRLRANRDIPPSIFSTINPWQWHWYNRR